MQMDYERRFDVLVVGAGVAGTAAALAAARAGASTALVEKTVLTGGLATTGLVNIYLPLCDGRGRQVTYGIAEELLHLSIKYGPGAVQENWRDPASRDRYRVPFSPAAFVLALDEVLASAGVAILLDTLVCLPVMEGDRLVGVEVEDRDGRGLLRARCVIDASGDAEVARRAGVPCVEGDNWVTIWSLQASLAAARKAAGESDGTPLLEGVRLGGGSNGWNAAPGSAKLHGMDAAQHNRFVLESRALLREHYRAEQAKGGDSSRGNLFPVTLPAMAQFRMTRAIKGQETLSDGQDGVRAETSVGLASDWRKPGPVWEIPYGTLVPQGVAGLLAAGRCISSVGDAWEVTRAIPVAALTGEAAGVAAALAVELRTTPDRLAVEDVQARLRGAGAPLHIDEVPAPGAAPD